MNRTDTMLSLLKTDIPVTRRKIIEFGVLFFTVLAVVLPLFVVWRNDWSWVPWLDWSVAVGIALLALCLGTGMMMAPLYKSWMIMALVLGTIMTSLIITVVFFVLITPIGILRRLFRSKSDYTTGFDRSKVSYWIERTSPSDPRSMDKMY